MDHSEQASQLISRTAGQRLSRAARLNNKSTVLADADANNFSPTVRTTVNFERADHRIAELLGLRAGDEICVRARVISADAVPVMLATSRLSRTHTKNTAIESINTGQGGIYARLEEAGHRLASFAERVTTRMPTLAERSALRLAELVPVFNIVRIAYTESEQPIEVNDMVLAGDRYELIYRIPAD